MTAREYVLAFVISLIQACIPFTFFHKLLGSKYKLYVTLPIYTFVVAITPLLVQGHITFTPKLFLIILETLLLVIFLFKGNLKQKITALVLDLLILIACDYLTFSISEIFHFSNEMTKVFFVNILYIVICPLVLFFAYTFIKNIMRVYDKKWFFSFLAIPVSQITLLEFSVLALLRSNALSYSDSGYAFFPNQSIPLLTVFLGVFSLVADIVFLNVSFKSASGLEEKRRLQALENESRLNLAYYSELQNDAKEMRKYRHDVNNIIQTLYYLLENPDDRSPDEVLRTAQSLEKEINEIGLKKYCDNNLINCILAINEKKFSQKGISCDFSADVPEGLNISELDLCRIMTNLLDNAYEALSAAVGETDLSVRFNASAIDGYLYIKTANSKRKEADLSPKVKDGKNRGLGLKIIKEISENNGGHFEFEDKGDSFEALAVIKIL